MHTILVTQDNELITSVKERIMQRSKLVDSLHFLVDPMYNDIDMSDFTVRLEYRLPISQEPYTELLTLSEELYKEKLEYKMPINTNLTKEAGNVEIQLSFTKLDLDADGNAIQYVRRTSPTTITIIPLSAWSNFVTDNSLNALDAAFLQLEGYMKRAEENAGVYDSVKADNIHLDSDTNEIYLTSEKGNRVVLSRSGE